MRLLLFAARHGRWGLIAGLALGLALPGVAAAMVPWLPHMVAGLLVLSALRIGARAALGSSFEGTSQGSSKSLGPAGTVLLLQLALPLCVAGVLLPLGLAGTPAGLAAILALSAPAITGSPNFAVLLGRDPAPSMRILVLGTALFPLTALPALMLLGASPWASLRLIAVILGAVAAGFALRALFLPDPTERQRQALDGAGVIALAVIVVALMAALAPALQSDPLRALAWLALAFAICFLPQIATRRLGTAASLAAGNRNVALWLVALPEETVRPLLIFVGAWQIPMYLTPMLLRRLHA